MAFGFNNGMKHFMFIIRSNNNNSDHHHHSAKLLVQLANMNNSSMSCLCFLMCLYQLENVHILCAFKNCPGKLKVQLETKCLSCLD